MAASGKSSAVQEKKNVKNVPNKQGKMKLYREKEKRWVKDKNEIKKLEEDCSEAINTSTLQRFLDFPISKRTFLGLKKAGYETPTEIQRESIVLALKGLDILGAAKTGSGKTLAFLIPILEILYRNEWSHLDGLGALIVTPVRELAYQIFEVLRKVGRLHEYSAGLIIGGKDLQFERSRIKSCNIIICTPGRLLQHMDENPLLDCSNIKVLVLDEADRMLDMGFAKAMNAIIDNLPQERQTLLFSATQTRSVKDLARLSLRDPVFVSVHEHSQHSTPESLQQSYIVCELHEKLNLLWSFIKNNLKQKILVFMTSCKQVKYAYEIICRMRPGMSVMALYGSMHQLKRMAVYNDFCNKEHTVLIATDIAARGLDFPAVNWVVQLDCPEDVNTYIHRAGRTARYETDGESLLVLLPSEEEAMVAQFTHKRIPITKIKVNPSRQHSIQRKLEAILARDVALKESAQRAFVTYIKSVFLMKDKKVFDITKLDTNAYAHSLGLAIPPRIRFLQKHQKLLEEREAKKLALIAKLQQKKGKEDQTSESSDSSEEEEEEEQSFEKKKADFKNASTKAVNDFSSFNGLESEGSDDDLLTVKRIIMPTDTVDDEDDAALEPQFDFSSSKKHSKPITKAAVAKKMLKKNIKPNQKVTFGDDGEVVVDVPKRQLSELAKETAENDSDGGINIEKAKAVMIEEDKIDKQLYRQKIKAKHKEKRLKEKERKNRHKAEMKESDEEGSYESSSDEAGSVDLDFLPDPDKIYGVANSDENDSSPSGEESHSGQSESEDDSEDESNSSESDGSASGEDIPETRKRKLDTKAAVPNKKKQVKHSVSNDAPLDTGLSLMDDEELAMHFLKHNS